MATAGFNCALKMAGTSTAFTGQTCTLVSGKTYRLPAAFRVLDPETTPTVYDNAVAVNAADIDSFDYLAGTVTFDAGYTVTGPVTADGDYYPMYTVSHGRSFDLTISRAMLETTEFSDANRDRIAGLVDATLTYESLDDARTDIDSTAGTRSMYNALTGGVPLVLEVGIGPTSKLFRLWVIAESLPVSSSVDDLVGSSLTFQLAARRAADGTEVGIAVI